ncbi:MAG: aldehyde dehydrogenase [Betaproteobacteria bacterium]
MNFNAPERVDAWIDGAAAEHDGTLLPIVNPATAQIVSQLVESDATVVDAAVRSAAATFARGSWRKTPVESRAAVLRRVADLIEQNAAELAWLECLASGIPMQHLRLGQIPRAAQNFRFFAEVINQQSGQLWNQNPKLLTYVTREPIGVAALLGPWNAPLALTSMKIAAAIAFGNSCVAKPSEVTPLAVARLMVLLREAGLPDGVVNLVNGRGPITGAALVAHPQIDLVSFTGGTTTGRAISEAAGRGLKPLSLELGGKSACIVFDSADLDRALDGALTGIFSNNGQQCLAGSRILLQSGIAERFLERFVERAKALRIGDPMQPDTQIGPLAFEGHLERVLGYVDVARADGCKLLAGGRRVDALRPGCYFEPTVVLAPSNAARVCREEIFGPFATFQIFDTAEQAVAIANDSDFGLVAYVWSDHLPTVQQCTRGIRAGVVWVNTPMARELRAPFGGVKDSGYGREGGLSSMQFYTFEKTISLAQGDVSP